MSENVISVGIVGAGRNTVEKHIPGLQALPHVEIVSVCNRTTESSQRVAAQFTIPKVYEDWQALVAAPDTDAIVIGTWPYMHHAITLAALQANKHVMCEARMAMNAGQAREMLRAAQNKPSLVTQVVPSPFTLGVDATIQRLIAEGYIGDILAINIRDNSGFLNAEAPLTWRQDFDLSGYNTMMMGVWYEALMRWVGEATRIRAMGKIFVHMRRDEHGRRQSVRIPEHIDVLAEMACGAQAHMQVSQVAGLAGPAEAMLYGSEGTLRFSQGKLYGGRRGDTALAEIAIDPAEVGFWRVEEEFVAAIRGQEKIKFTTFEDGVKYMEFTEAVARSIAQGRAITLPLAL